MDEPQKTNRIIQRIEREADVPGLVEILTERLSPTDLQSLLLEVYRRRAARVATDHLLDRYERDRFVRPSDIDPRDLADLESLVWSLLPDTYQPLELSPVCPLGTNAAIATVDQNKVLSTIRNSEVVADSTNVLALECALRRRSLLRDNPHSNERVRLAASHRLLRGQAYASANAVPHFRLLGLCVAGRDEGSFRFETDALVEQIAFYLRLLAAARGNYRIGTVRVALTDLDGRREQILSEQVLAPLRAGFPDVTFEFDPDRVSGRGYYVAACFHVYMSGGEIANELADGGFTTWTQQLLSNRKERLLISGMGTERLAGSLRRESSDTQLGG